MRTRLLRINFPLSGTAAAGALFVALLLRFEALPVARADELDSVLGRKITPGSISLLAAHTGESGVSERLKLALVDPNPEVRGVAARVINLGALGNLLSDVETALRKESDRNAAIEEIRALCSLGGSPHGEAVLAAARRLGSRVERELVRIVARIRGPLALTIYFQTLRDLPLTGADRETFFRFASRGQADSLHAAAALAFGRHDTASWQAVLSVASELGVALAHPLFVQALRSSESVFRGEAAWYLAKTYCGRPAENAAELLAALSETDTGPPEGTDPELHFGAEMLRRVLGQQAVEDEAWIACLRSNPSCHLDSDVEESPLVDYLTPREREAILRRNEANLPPEARPSGKKPGAMSGAGPRADLFLVTGLPTGAARDLFDIGGCRSSWQSRRFSVGTLEFRPDGLPKHVSVTAVPPGKWCDRIADALYLLSLAPGDTYISPDRKLTYVALYDPDSIVCSEEDPLTGAPEAEDSTEVLRVRARIVAPKLRNRVEPIYPEPARKNAEQGVSMYEAIISSKGCIRDLRLLRSSTPLLDIAGIEAISRWKYQPATLNGRPVRVYLTVTVTYRLH